VSDRIRSAAEEVAQQRDGDGDDRKRGEEAEDCAGSAGLCGGGLLDAALGDALEDVDLAVDSGDEGVELGDVGLGPP
jgi:hypothetical protein